MTQNIGCGDPSVPGNLARGGPNCWHSPTTPCICICHASDPIYSAAVQVALAALEATKQEAKANAAKPAVPALTGKDFILNGFNYGKTRPDGQHERYPTDGKTGGPFIRPIFRSYIHVGRSICGKPRPTEPEVNAGLIWACPDKPGHEGSCTSWRHTIKHDAQRQHEGGCGTETTMGLALCETYARTPNFYGATFCAGCGDHFPVGDRGEFIWANDPQQRRVGT